MPPKTLKAACVQMTSGPYVDANIAAAEAFIRDAAGQGATLIATPEMTDSIRRYAKDKIANPGDRAVAHFAALAAELGVYLLIGSLGIAHKNKLANRSFLFGPDGREIAHYDKIHMFDVKLSRTEFYNESKEYEPGDRAVVEACDDFKLGMGVCYDLRFPHLWRDLAREGADILSAPAAFTVPTGKAHWEILLRARAIETGCFVIAPAQIGEHEGGRLTYGHSMIINPWGEILAEKSDGIGIITAEIDMAEVTEARQRIPALQHDQKYSLMSS